MKRVAATGVVIDLAAIATAKASAAKAESEIAAIEKNAATGLVEAAIARRDRDLQRLF